MYSIIISVCISLFFEIISVIIEIFLSNCYTEYTIKKSNAIYCIKSISICNRIMNNIMINLLNLSLILSISFKKCKSNNKYVIVNYNELKKTIIPELIKDRHNLSSILYNIQPYLALLNIDQDYCFEKVLDFIKMTLFFDTKSHRFHCIKYGYNDGGYNVKPHVFFQLCEELKDIDSHIITRNQVLFHKKSNFNVINKSLTHKPTYGLITLSEDKFIKDICHKCIARSQINIRNIFKIKSRVYNIENLSVYYLILKKIKLFL